MQIIFETPRLYLRQFTEADTALILELNSQPETIKYLHEPLIKTLSDAGNILTNIILPQYELKLGRCAIHLKDTNEFIGWCGLKYRPELEEIDLGYRFMQQYWGRGYATEAARHTLDHGFQTLKLKRITGRAHIENMASLKVLEKIGMRFVKEETVDDCPVKTFVAVNTDV